MGIELFGSAELKKGLKAEQKVKRYLENKGYKVEDVSSLKEFRTKDIDLIVQSKSGYKTIEVKSYSKGTPAYPIVIEDILNIKKGKAGWIWYCKAEYLCTVNGDKLYFYRTNDMRKYIKMIKEYEKKHKCRYKSRRDLKDPSVRDSISSIIIINSQEYKKFKFFLESVDINGEIV